MLFKVGDKVVYSFVDTTEWIGIIKEVVNDTYCKVFYPCIDLEVRELSCRLRKITKLERALT